MAGFTKKSAQRIARAVRLVERGGVSLVGGRRGKFDRPPGAGFEVLGDEGLYKVIALREYDADGVLIDIGSETTPLPEGHTLEPTWDYVRAV